VIVMTGSDDVELMARAIEREALGGLPAAA